MILKGLFKKFPGYLQNNILSHDFSSSDQSTLKFSNLFKLGYTPRWIIVCIDIFLTFFSVILSFLLRFNFKPEAIIHDLFLRGILVTVGIYILSFFIVKSYKEIIRHATYRSVLKILYAIIMATTGLLLINIFMARQEDFFVVPFSVLLINFFISFFMLAGSRFFIKQVFDTALRLNAQPVFIFGAGAVGQAALKAIMHDRTGKLKVAAFIDDDPATTGRSISGIPVYTLDQLDKLQKKHSAKKVIIAVNNISLERRNEVASLFISNGLLVSVLNSEQQFPDAPFILRRLKDIKIEDLLERDPIKIDNVHINATLHRKRILVTGAAGSIGSEIVKQVADFKPELIILCDIAESPLHNIGLELEEQFPDVPQKRYIANITDARRMEYIFRNFAPHIVFHAAAYKHVPMMEEHPQEALSNNVAGTKIVADLSVQYGAERFVMVSTDKAVNPTNIMGASKRIAEMYIQGLYEAIARKAEISGGDKAKKTLFITTRFGNVLASNGSVIPRFKEQLAKGGPITVTHPSITRYFMTIPEACQLVLEAGVMGKGGEVFVFDMGKSIRITDLAHNMIILAGLRPGHDIEIRYTGLRPGEKLYEELLNNEEITLPTYHPKIKIARVQSVDFTYINNALSNLQATALKGIEDDCVKLMKEIVPEFISNNSRFEYLDRSKKETDNQAAIAILNTASENNDLIPADHK
ncbi:MAG: nucleoside-diphosphate sugar epimerase/dehydratase [Panacibacter sp.]